MTTTPYRTRPTRAPAPGSEDPPTGATLVLAVDATDPAPVRTLPAAAARLRPGDRLVVAVLHPPARLTLNARLVAWQHTQRARATTATLAPLLTRIDRRGLLTRGVQVHTLAWTYRRGLRPRHHRIATALLALCRVHHADQLVLAAGPHAGLLTPATGRRLAEAAPAGLSIHRLPTTPAPDATPSPTPRIRPEAPWTPSAIPATPTSATSPPIPATGSAASPGC
ncbi:hypothetical protein IU436_29165 [Nocardia farcinica]|uniref:hypothetical protein n=1 Tax=Nocardia farcinica TaxID=37329 RepID=UPI0018941584|nr:hypothetical protein [Nocardia farcinica]MBF6234840.1 hypothetical protein [Nocardia farcinica]MBF6257212.1 hypothetical protein [Nocardia farcinica]MBF6265545.1 hypothetical protein [Nocardia farcinica]MBF6271284.1 hypothetical protein [Nocardia farcinica]MBF6422751.1 hypothetical protein [Nocardia farcinica]